MTSYYDQPIVKQPTWKAWIPLYFATGGTAAGSSLIAAGADASGNEQLARVARATALVSISASAGALIADLGKPSRFHHMLRVVRPSSPMNVGSWLLAAYGPAVGLAALTKSRVATWTAAALAPAVATYTGVLVADTALPAWREAARSMPALFAASSAASSGGVVVALAGDRAEPARRLAIAGALAELTVASAQHRAYSPDVRRTLEDGAPRRFRMSASALTAVGLGCLSARSRTLHRIGGVATTLGATVQRFAVYEAGRASAADPRATTGPQRRISASESAIVLDEKSPDRARAYSSENAP